MKILSAKERLHLKQFDKDYLTQLYAIKNMSIGDIAELAKVSRTAIHKRMKKYKIPRKTKGQARQLALEKQKLSWNGREMKRKTWNKDFFNTWSNNMAWVLGIIYTDGCLSNIRYYPLSLSQKEPELLEKVLSCMDAIVKIHKRKNGKSYLHTFSFGDQELYDQLTALGVYPRKSLTLCFPEIPEKFKRHFVRGCWDGDGSFHSGGASFVSGAENFIRGIAKTLESAGIVGNSSIRVYAFNLSKNPSYMIRINPGKERMKRLYEYFYKNVSDSEYLQRKHDALKGLRK